MRTLSATTWPTSGGQKRVTNDDRLPPKESSMRKGSTMHDKSQVNIEGEPKREPKSRQMIDEEEVTSERLRMNDVANMKTEVRYDGVVKIFSNGVKIMWNGQNRAKEPSKTKYEIDN